MLTVESVIVGAASALVGSVLARAFGRQAGVRPGGVQAVAARVPETDSGLERVESVDVSEVPPVRARLLMGAVQQVHELVSHLVAEGYARPCGSSEKVSGRYSDKVWLAEYHAWAERFGVVVVPETVFLTLLGRHPQIQKSRDRVKDARTGRVLRNAAGTPLRAANYTLLEQPPVMAVEFSRETGRRRRVLVDGGALKRAA